MKTWALVILVAIGAVGIWAVSQIPQKPNVTISMYSDPFPMVIGPTKLYFTVTDEAGLPVDAELSVAGNMLHQGMLPLNIQTIRYEDGVYEIPVIWPMMGQWQVDVSAQLPNGQGTVEDQFAVYIYATAVNVSGDFASYRSASQSRALITDPAREFAIIIPQGTDMLIMEGQAEDVIPPEIYLNVNGQNTLVIQNNDIVDHTIGPYLVRAGEVVRQSFTRPAVYQGKCSVNLAAEFSIIVEG